MILAFAAAAAASSSTDALAVQALHNYGACIAEQTPRGVRAVLALDYRSKEYQTALKAMVKGHDRCMPFDGRLGSSDLLFAGAMAEAMLKSDIPGTQLSQRIAYDPGRLAITARSPMEGMALCTVLQSPAATVRLFATKPATPEETQAMKPLGPVLTGCLKKNMRLEVNKPALRSLLALAAWRVATTPSKTDIVETPR